MKKFSSLFKLKNYFLEQGNTKFLRKEVVACLNCQTNVCGGVVCVVFSFFFCVWVFLLVCFVFSDVFIFYFQSPFPSPMCVIIFATGDCYLYSSRVRTFSLYLLLMLWEWQFFNQILVASVGVNVCVVLIFILFLARTVLSCLSCHKVLKPKFNPIMFYGMIQKNHLKCSAVALDP